MPEIDLILLPSNISTMDRYNDYFNKKISMIPGGLNIGGCWGAAVAGGGLSPPDK